MTDSADPTYYVSLTFDELACLDGKCSAKVQEKLDKAREQRSLIAEIASDDADAARIAASIVQSVKARLQLDQTYQNAKEGYISGRCECCKTTPGYVPYARSGRYAVKGQPNRDRPRTRHMTKFNGTGLCQACVARVKPLLVEALKDVPAQYPQGFFGEGYVSPLTVHEAAYCTACDWEGHEGQMLRKGALMGGTYPGGCPSCKAENLMFGRTIVERSSKALYLTDRAGDIVASVGDPVFNHG